MKFVCPACERLLELEQFRFDPPALVVSCSRCGVESRLTPGAGRTEAAAPPAALPDTRFPPRVSLESAEGASNVVVLKTASHDAVRRAAEAAANPFAIPDGLCPKCLVRRNGDAECRNCGLRFDGFDENAMLPPKVLRDDWVGLLGEWGNEQRHALFRRKAQQLDALAAVGRLYRLRQAHFPEDPLAAAALSDILRIAAVPMGLPRTDEGSEQRRRTIVLTAAIVVVILLLGLLVKVLFGGPPPNSVLPPPPVPPG
ncbi:MAG: hypothetical protein U0228_06620 [Myxococcaceae bacterium]